MYKNVWYKRETNSIHIWDDVRGYSVLPYSKYAYEIDPNGTYTSIYGDSLRKVFNFKRGATGLFESDVNETTRALIDMYSDNDEPSKGIVTMTFDIEVEMESGLPNVKTAQNALTAIGGHDTKTNQYWVLVMDTIGNMVPKRTNKAFVLPFTSERDMLLRFLDIYRKTDPDIITGWNTDQFDIPYLYNRIKNILGESYANKLSKIGEIKYNERYERYSFAGVSSLDYLSLYKNFTYSELPNYRLDTVSKMELDRGKIEYEGNLDQLFNDDIDTFIEYNLVDVELVVELDKKLQFIDLARGISHVGHTPYEDIVFSSKYLEGALLTYLRRKNLVAPNKPKKLNMKLVSAVKGNKSVQVIGLHDKVPTAGWIKLHKSSSSKLSVQYDGIDKVTGAFILLEPLPETFNADIDVTLDFAGAYVKDPIKGKYEWIYDLDLTSLYPSIIMTLNISPETKLFKIDNWDIKAFRDKTIQTFHVGDRNITNDKLEELLTKNNLSISSNGVLYSQDKVGCIPGILNDWFDKRVEYKDLMKKFGKSGDDDKYQFYHKRQLVQKILLNSLYGALGLGSFRFYDIDNAAAVTTSGQVIIQSTASKANEYYNLELGGNPIIIEFEDRDDLILYPNTKINVIRNEGQLTILGKELKETDDFIGVHIEN